MIATVSLAFATTLSFSITCDVPGGMAPTYRPLSDFQTLDEGGKTYIEFRDAAEKRVEAWHEHYAQAEVPDAVMTRVAAVTGSWKLLVIAEDWCGDSANTIPYVAKLVDVAPQIDMRIINSEIGRSIMEAHRTMDGRTATPTVILLNESFEEAGCWVERPSTLDHWFQANKDVLEEDALYDQKYAWYAEDQGGETLGEIVELIESAARGQTICRSQNG